ncbi:MAG: hypothetical protein IJD22_05095 [Clostridia bacterium]|nr:hypothetical protein [Clostridia bacterium]
MSVEFACQGKKQWEYTASGIIKINGEDLVTPRTISKIAVKNPASADDKGCIVITDCFDREKKLWFAYQEKEKAEAVVSALKSRLGIEETYLETVEDDGCYEAEASVEPASASDGHTEEKTFGKSRTGEKDNRLKFKSENPVAAELSKKAQSFQKIGVLLYRIFLYSGCLVLLISFIAAIAFAVEAESFFTFVLILGGGAASLGIGYLNAIIAKFICECFTAFFNGQAHMVQNSTVTARANLYMAEKHSERE